MHLSRKVYITVTTLSSIAALIGIILATSANFTFDLLLRTQMVVSPNSLNFKFWSELPEPIKTSVYLFNVTNYEDFVSNGAKPELVEVGPYVFDENHKKVDLVWNPNGTVTYKQVKTFQFVREDSVGSLNDTVVILNVPAATIGATASKLSQVERKLLNVAISGILKEELFVKKTVGEILFEGYEDPLLSAAEIIQKFHIPIPGLMDKFGFYYGRNNTDWWDGVFNMYTGFNNIHHLGEIYAWNYSKQTDFFPSRCGQVRGASDLFPPYMPSEKVEMFSNDLCRPIELAYDSWSFVKGTSGKRYVIDSMFFANSSVNYNNWCFENGAQLPSGLYNASSCRFGAPIFMSQPHFYQADPYYLAQFQSGSLNPVEDKHETVFVIEAQTGIPLSVLARFQVNALVTRIDELDLFKNVPEKTFFPIVWFETKYQIPDFLASSVWFVGNLYFIMIIVGALMALGGLLTTLWYVVCIKPPKVETSSNYTTLPNTEIDTEEGPQPRSS